MAIKEQVILEVKEVGMDEYIDKGEKMSQVNKDIADTNREVSGSMRESSNAVLDNGGAMGILNDITGGYAMLVKDAVEASVLFTKSQKLAAIQQKIYTAVVGASSGAMKIFRIALVSTGIGAIVVALGLLIANFDKVKKAVMNLVPGLAAIGKFIGGLIDAVTDFVGVTNDATRELDKMEKQADESLKRTEHFLEANGDKYDQYTRRKLQANIDYQKKVKEINADEELDEQEKLQRIADFRAKANREIIKADKDREAEREKIRKEAADKEAEELKRKEDEAQRAREKAIAKERERVNSIQKILEDYRKKEEDAEAKSNLQKINLEEQRAMAELDRLRATEKQKAEVRDYYNTQRLEEEKRLQQELRDIEQNKNDAVRNLELDQKQWEVDNETDPLVKLEKQRELLEQQGALDLEKLQRDIDNANLSAAERANAEIEYARVKQDLNQALADNDRQFQETQKQIAEEQKQRDKSVAENKKSIAFNTAQAIAELSGKGAQFAKGVAAAQAIQETYKGAVSAYTGMLQAFPGPIGVAAGAVAAGATVAMGLANVKKILATKPVESSAPGASGGSGANAPAAPAFNLVQGTGSNQIAETIANQNTPIQAYVVSSNVTTAQSMERNIVENSTL